MHTHRLFEHPSSLRAIFHVQPTCLPSRIANETVFANGKYDQRGLHSDQADFGELVPI